MAPTPISIIIVSWNTRALLRDCLAAVCPQLLPGDEVIVVDNHSGDGSAAMVEREFPAVRLIANQANVGYARANNQGLRESRGAYALLLNSDTIAPAGSLRALADFLDQHPDAGACGPRLLLPDGSPQAYAFGGDPTLWYLLRRAARRLVWRRPLHDWATETVQPVDWVSGAGMLVRRAAIEQAGLLDEAFFMYFEDNEWCLRIRKAGWAVYYNPRVSIVHLGGQSLAQNPRARQAYYRSLAYFYAKHYGPVAAWTLKLLLWLYTRPMLRRRMRRG